MDQNLISGTISAEDLQAIQDALNVINTKLPFLSAMQNMEVNTIFKVGNVYQPLLDLALQVVDTHPEVLPPVFNKEEFRKDYALYKTVNPLALQVAEIHTGLQKTEMAVGSDSLIEALEIYAAVKQNKDKVAGLSAVYDEMRAFFRKNKIKTTPTQP